MTEDCLETGLLKASRKLFCLPTITFRLWKDKDPLAGHCQPSLGVPAGRLEVPAEGLGHVAPNLGWSPDSPGDSAADSCLRQEIPGIQRVSPHLGPRNWTSIGTLASRDLWAAWNPSDPASPLPARRPPVPPTWLRWVYTEQWPPSSPSFLTLELATRNVC